MKRILFVLAACCLLCSCARNDDPAAGKESLPEKRYTDTSDRKSGPAMLLLEQAEEDADVNNVIVIPPDQKQKESVDR